MKAAAHEDSGITMRTGAECPGAGAYWAAPAPGVWGRPHGTV